MRLFVWFLPLALAAAPDAATRARDALRHGAADTDPEVRREVAVSLSLIAVKDSASPLLPQLAADKDYLVREAALVSIGELRDPALAKPARDALNDEVPEVVFAAARTLFRLRQPEGREVLVNIVQKEEKAKSGFIRSKLRDVSRRFKTPKSAFLFAMQQGVGFVPLPGMGEGYSAMASMLTDAEFSPRATALVMLAADRSAEVRTLIEDAFADSEWSMRAAAVQIAALRQQRDWRERMEPLLEDTHRKVRYRAAACYLRLGHRVPARNSPQPAGPARGGAK
jgi:HEAT repeat protein